MGGGGHGAAGGASSRGGKGEGGAEGKLRIHLKRSCTDRKVVQGNTELGLTTDGEEDFLVRYKYGTIDTISVCFGFLPGKRLCRLRRWALAQC